ncbi:hypothetical protein [Mycobacterium haemophilum]|uniref:Uncharacterized protein n=1 Tax=Mycobacterium haemophilum TaxID=29311 RepID=A0A0I9UPI8_9MYCO|nr:hypothetical protein [Mycobacterium haemophilum]KLO28427.1 hypothetical protein ABH39_14330 [Mycobacterium haemophilum]KLO37469.1 hypothetical protein ABH38_08795 [Mycobacterium haemophilum]KLO44018.1 hypothetical protein ABH37_06320 [Mycobacterium haemophilum]KLO49298.1 hypothetical protein ABH36_13185 [Mycobacterium haemophilum]
MDEPSEQVQIPLILVAIDRELPGRIADLYSIQSDLKFARDCAAEYTAQGFVNGQPSTDQAQTLLNRALWSAALIAYRRAFNSGRGHIHPRASRFDLRPLRETLLSTTQQDAHDGFLEVANQHIAHRVTEHEQMNFLAALYPPPLARGLDGIFPLQTYWNAPLLPDAESFIEICNVLIAYTDKEVDDFLDGYLAQLHQQGVDHLYDLAETQRQDPEDDPPQ